MNNMKWMGMVQSPNGDVVMAHDGTIYRQTFDTEKFIPLNPLAKSKREYTDYTREGKTVKATY